ncbi:hypothetical protein QAD02_001198 [Eretmocerus hayati]|uniref:Uncharacterized protein n=1 Tax=Eretmocerus hayati TaxID=131215 RepID=A0ACC2NFB8_9HYME|nr:hypothetical protein QAD02_001198 [Eretmocerus hayati]
MSGDSRCGLCGVYPKWIQSWATSRNFIAVYGLLGTIQAMAFIYMGVSLTTLEKRFKIPSRTTGIILSGNEISQILSILLIYYGGSGHRPRWIAAGVAFSAASCFVLALPHLIYGPGQNALVLTKEYLNSSSSLSNVGDFGTPKSKNSELSEICWSNGRPDDKCGAEQLADTSLVPKLLVFFSQFILGIGTTLYYGLGQTFLDDNSKKKNTPMLLAVTFALRTVGPAFGFVLGYLCLKIYIAPTLHPIIENDDPRWLGAWWLGWVILGTSMAVIAVLLAMFPRELQKSKKSSKKQILIESEMPLKKDIVEKKIEKSVPQEMPSLKDFPKMSKRILKNKLLMFNIASGIFYILSAAPFMSFITKYLEVLYQTKPGEGTVVVGPLTLIGMIVGFLVSGLVISRLKPSPRPLLFWNVIIGLCYFSGQLSFTFFGCDTGAIQGIDYSAMKVNLITPCNSVCNCGDVKYSPVCHEPTKTTYFSACHAGCHNVVNETIFTNCSCVIDKSYNQSAIIQELFGPSETSSSTFEMKNNKVIAGVCKNDCFRAFVTFTIISLVINILGCSGRLGNVLVNFRCVEKRDKSLAQGISLMLISIFALIPGPIIFGAIMDSTCLVWDMSCKTRGNCWIYHRDSFRYYVNLTSACLSLCGAFFDGIVCYLSKGVDLYGDLDETEPKRPTFSELDKELKLSNQHNTNLKPT